MSTLPARDTTCPADERLSVSDPKCLSLADIPALEGDHSASPVILYWRWFDACTRSDDNMPGDLGALEAIVRLPYADESPETVPTGIPKTVRSFLALVHGAGLAAWPGTPYGWVAGDDLELQNIDSSYGALAIDGHSHFRHGLASFDDAFATRRYTYRLKEDPPGTWRHKPELNNFAWYADLHSGAVIYARAAATSPSADASRLFDAVSMFLELAADHYLEDALSAGHMVSLARELDPGTLNMVHDAACTNGVPAYLPKALCDTPQSSALTQACSERSKKTKVLGDHAVARGFGRDGDATLTFNWASAVVQLSVLAVLRARDDSRLDAAARRLTDAFGRLDDKDLVLGWFLPGASTSPSCGPSVREGERSFYRALMSWWETKDPEATRAFDIMSLHDQGYFVAAEALPIPVPPGGEVDGNASRFAGPGWYVEAGGLATGAPGFTGTPEVNGGLFFASPKNRYAGIQARIGAGSAVQQSRDGGGTAAFTARIAAREGIATIPWFFFEQQIPIRRLDEYQVGIAAGVGITPFERTNGALSLSLVGGALYDRALKQVVPTGSLTAMFGFPLLP